MKKSSAGKASPRPGATQGSSEWAPRGVIALDDAAEAATPRGRPPVTPRESQRPPVTPRESQRPPVTPRDARRARTSPAAGSAAGAGESRGARDWGPGPPPAAVRRVTGAGSDSSLDRLRKETLHYSLWNCQDAAGPPKAPLPPNSHHSPPSEAGEHHPDTTPSSASSSEIPSRFQSATEYVSAFEPLLFEECRAQVLSQWDEAAESQAAVHMPVRMVSLERADRGWWELWLGDNQAVPPGDSSNAHPQQQQQQQRWGQDRQSKRGMALSNWKDGDVAVLSPFNPKQESGGAFSGGQRNLQASQSPGGDVRPSWRIAGTIRSQQQDEDRGPGGRMGGPMQRSGPLFFVFHETALHPQ